MPDIAAIADMLARGGPAELAEVEQEITRCEQRLEWLRLIHDTLIRGRGNSVRATATAPAKPTPRRLPGSLRETVCAAMNGEWLTVREIANKADAPPQSIRIILNACPHLFEKRETGEFTSQHHACVEYRKRSLPG